MASSVDLKANRKPTVSKSSSPQPPQKTEVFIHVYDLLPPGRLSSTLWVLGSSLLHSGVVIRDKEYAYGGHAYRGLSGVYWTRPGTEPPGGTFRGDILHGFTMKTQDEISATIKEVSEEFLGPSYNLLNRNCNHFTSALCQRLTSRPAPNWLNRAASIGLALPCVVPRDWLAPPDHDTADGELVDETDEQSMMLRSRRSVEQYSHRYEASAGAEGAQVMGCHEAVLNGNDEQSGRSNESTILRRDTSGRTIPASERAPEP